MKKRILSVLLVITMLTLMVACAKTNETGGQSAPTDNDTVVETTTPSNTVTPENSEVVSEPDSEAENDTVVPETEAVHEHEYAEEIVVAATCTESGTVSYTCECGDTYSEEIEPTGHDWGEYASNGDATYFADGTKTAVCASCGETDTVPDDGSKLAYTYTDCEAVKYAQQTVNVRSGPSTDFDKVGSLSTNQEVTVTGTCNETGWYRIVYGDDVAYVSNKYLGDSKVEVSAPPADNGGGGNSNAPAGVPNPYDYPVSTWIDMGDWMFYVHPALESPEPNVNGALWENARATLQARYPGSNISGRTGIKLNNGTYTAWMVAVGGTNSSDYPQAQLKFIATYQGR